MNFFEHQDQAKKSTRKLVLLFTLAIVSLIAMTTLFVSLFFYYFNTNQLYSTSRIARSGTESTINQILNWEITGYVALAVITLVTLGSLYKLIQLRQGGYTIATALGGRRILPNTDNPQERQLLNVIEEMAIASGTQIPTVYLLEEPGINAFAAGHTPRDAVIGVTRGCMELLNREQLQGVMAHEFSHILNGDMKINLHLLGILHGILMIGLIGSMLMRSRSRSFTISRSRNKGDSGIALLGFGLIVIGYSGTFFGKLIKSAISRQREFLADACAVQYTRNPEGISQALQKIGGHIHGSSLSHFGAEQFSHMYFGDGVRSAADGLMATHPPLQLRIKRITPTWNGQFITAPLSSAAVDTESSLNSYSSSLSVASSSLVDQPISIMTAGREDRLIANTAKPSPTHLERATRLLTTIPSALNEGARNPFTARAIVYNLLINNSQESSAQQQRLQQRAHPVAYKEFLTLRDTLNELPAEQKLPLFELSLPALKQLSTPQYQVFKDNVIALIKADRKVAIFEWALYRMLLNALEHRPKQNHHTTTIKSLAVPIQQVLSTLSHHGHDQQPIAEAAYNNAMRELKLPKLPLLDSTTISLPLLDSALSQLQALRPLQKPALLKALLHCVQHDGTVTPSEFELFRAIASCIDCPTPPLT